MKELSIEQKAKAYDKAIKVAADIKAGNATYITDGTPVIDAIFPELKESEDEQHRKWIIEYLYDGLRKSDEQFKGQFKAAIAWLEKQESVDEIVSRCRTSWYNEGKIDGMAEGLTDDEKYQQGWHDALEKQGEQKPFDYENANIQQKDFAPKVKPKFKVGDWITNGDYIWKIVGVKPLDYMLQSQDGNIVDDTISYVDEQFHSFTIKDAKNGDVLVLNDEVFIYAHRKQLYSIAVAHCFVDSAGGFYFEGEFGYTERGNSIHPTSKKQRDLLFQKMKEAGYEWDAEKKELKKIEQRPAELCENRSKELSLSLQIQAYLNTASDELYAQGKPLYSEERIKDIHKCMLMWQKLHNAYFYQNPAWSEEDEEWDDDRINMFYDIQSMIKCCDTIPSCGGILKPSDDYKTRLIDWLKSLRPKNRWKPSDEQIEMPENVRKILHTKDIYSKANKVPEKYETCDWLWNYGSIGLTKEHIKRLNNAIRILESLNERADAKYIKEIKDKLLEDIPTIKED